MHQSSRERFFKSTIDAKESEPSPNKSQNSIEINMTPATVSVPSSHFGSKKNSTRHRLMAPIESKKLTGRNFIEMNKTTLYPK